MNPEDRNNLIKAYAEGYAALLAALDEFPRTMWRYKPAPDKWSLHDILVHMADDEVNGYIRLRVLLAEPGKELMAYDQDAWADRLDYQSQDAEDALELFRCLRVLNGRMLQSLPEQAWTHTVEHPEAGTQTLEDWLAAYSKHVPVHINQMRRIFEAWQKEEAAGQS